MTVGGHMTIYLARTGVNHFWERPFPSRQLFFTAEITQVIGTFVAVYGFDLMAPIGWTLAGVVWGYAFLSFALTDLLKTHFFSYARRHYAKRPPPITTNASVTKPPINVAATKTS